MGTNEFGHGVVSGANMARPGSADLARASAIHGALPIAPTAASRRVANAAVNPRGMPQSNSNVRFSSRSAAATAGAGSTNPGWRSMNGYNANGAARGNSGGNGGGPAATNRGGGANPTGSAGINSGARSGATPQSGYGNAPRGGSNEGAPRTGGYATPQNRAPTSQQQPVRMNPPIVQPRSAPSNSGASRPAPGPSGGGGGSHSAPAPSRSGGGGGGHGGGHR